MYGFFLSLHNIMRWVVVILAIVAAVTAFIGWFGNRPYTDRDNRIGLVYTIAMDIQLLIGFLLYFVLSPFTKVAFSDFGAAMANADLRYFAVEHIFIMVIAVVLAHLGRVLSKRQSVDKKKFQWAAILFTLSLLVMLAGTPWFRPMFRMPF